MTTAIVTHISNGLDHLSMDSGLSDTLRGMLAGLEYSSISLRGLPDQAYSMDMRFDRARDAYRFTFTSDTTDARKEVDVPVSMFRGLLQDYADTRNGAGQAYRSFGYQRMEQIHRKQRDQGGYFLQQGLKARGVDVPFETAESLFRVIATEYKFESAIGR